MIYYTLTIPAFAAVNISAMTFIAGKSSGAHPFVSEVCLAESSAPPQLGLRGDGLTFSSDSKGRA